MTRAARASLIALFVTVVTAAAFGRTSFAKAHAIAAPDAVALALWADATRSTLVADVGATLARTLASSLIALALATTLGLALGPRSSPLRALVPALHFARSIPPALAYPLLLLSLGHNERSRVAAAAFGSFALAALPVARAVESIADERLEIARLAGLSRVELAFTLYWPEALPALFVGARLVFAQCLIVAIVTEMLVAPTRGLGLYALGALQEYRADRLWVALAIAGSISVAVSAAIARVEHRALRSRH